MVGQVLSFDLLPSKGKEREKEKSKGSDQRAVDSGGAASAREFTLKRKGVLCT